MPCPNEVAIPEIFALFNGYFMKSRDESVIDKYDETIPAEKRVKKCAKCGQCEEKCPQQLPVRNLLGRATSLFESDR